MQVTLSYVEDCPNWPLARERLRQALDQLGHDDTAIRYVVVRSEAQARALGFAGSPSFTVDGVDLFGGAAPTGALACRLYPTAEGLAGAPAVSDLVAALSGRATV